jgi:hypothetical protein
VEVQETMTVFVKLWVVPAGTEQGAAGQPEA